MLFKKEKYFLLRYLQFFDVFCETLFCECKNFVNLYFYSVFILTVCEIDRMNIILCDKGIYVERFKNINQRIQATVLSYPTIYCPTPFFRGGGDADATKMFF